VFIYSTAQSKNLREGDGPNNMTRIAGKSWNKAMSKNYRFPGQVKPSFKRVVDADSSIRSRQNNAAGSNN
jgi:hypothetical protein